MHFALAERTLKIYIYIFTSLERSYERESPASKRVTTWNDYPDIKYHESHFALVRRQPLYARPLNTPTMKINSYCLSTRFHARHIASWGSKLCLSTEYSPCIYITIQALLCILTTTAHETAI